MDTRLLELAHKPIAGLSVSTYTPPSAQQGSLSNTLVLFINGLSATQSSWYPVAEKLIRQREGDGLSMPLLLSYDRYGQGDSDSDPADGPDKPHGHSISDVITDLHHLLEHACKNIFYKKLADMRLILVCHAMGCALARLYTAAHPSRVEALLFLDSAIANSDFVSLFPDPDSERARLSKLPPGVTPENLRHARAVSQKYFHPTSPTKENMDHRDLPILLPDAGKPTLPNGPSGKRPLLVVVGHDWNVFANESRDVSFSSNELPCGLVGLLNNFRA